MAIKVQVERCNYCRRRFYASEYRCPDCGRRGRSGRRRTVFMVVGLAIIAAFAVKLLHSIATKPPSLPPLPAASDGP